MTALAAGDGLAITGDVRKDPSNVIKAYLSLDAKGARLDAISYETLKPYTNWKRELSWGIVTVIDSYEVAEDVKTWQVLGRMEVIIPVTYKVLGTMDWETVTYTPEPQVEHTLFRVKVIGDRWRILEPTLPPHVGLKRMISFVRQGMLQETDPARLAKMHALWDDLKKAQ
ncbi:MAG TPA: hypothetical protein VGQ60_03045 [Nitrospiraceae bacterium]|jgi:hypothetical protein|nr:hypothetical protein [Nitrospiraceae bacterium]